MSIEASKPDSIVGEIEIKQVETMFLCGVAADFDMQTRAKGIPALWQKFVSLVGNIPEPLSSSTYGACVGPGPAGAGFRYQAALQVKEGALPPAGCEIVEVPEGQYAVFTHSGSTQKIKDSVEYVWSVWLPGNGKWQHRMAPDFEYYDERFDPVAETGQMDIYIPVSPK